MKIFKFAMASVLAAAFSCGFVACSDDDKNSPDSPDAGLTPGGKPTVEEVFPAGLPKQVGDMAVKTDSEGRVVELSSDDEVIKFKYEKVTRSTTFDVVMECYDTYNGKTELEYTIYLQLNERGFVQYAEEVYADDEDDDESEIDRWWFRYNAAGQLTYMKRSENDNEEVFIDYKADEIVVKEREEGSSVDDEQYHIYYTDAITKTAIPNKGGIMLFDILLCVDMDEMQEAYYAGLLGTATQYLPVYQVYSDDEGGYSYHTHFQWTLNSEGLPTEMTESELNSDGEIVWTSSDKFPFRW